MNATNAAWTAAEPHKRREYAVPCVGGCGRLVLDIAGSFHVPWCDDCKKEVSK